MRRLSLRSRLAIGAAIVWSWSLAVAPSEAAAAGWKAGTARVAITPKQPTWMAGYGGRTKPSEGAVHDLWAKALVLEDPTGGRAALVSLDICGIGRDLSVQVRDALKSRLGLDRDRIVLACSHTHCGPVIGTNLISMYPMNDEQKQRVEQYGQWLVGAVVDTTVKAAGQLQPAELSWGTGRADFAVNRRENAEKNVPKLREQLSLKGPNDHDVPVLQLKGSDGRAIAIVCGYSCHCTVMSFYQFCGDYAGFAQLAIEKANPGAQAMFVAGCGADQNPLPRRTLELAANYGNQLATAVQRVLGGPMQTISGPLATAYTEIDLAFDTLPTREKLQEEANSRQLALANRAKTLLKVLDSQGRLSPSYPYPVEVWRLGDLTWVFLGGEVVVDYSLRIKRNLGSSHTWVSSYCNDVCAYIPSLRVLKEGGYEGATSMVVYGQPTTWSPRVEEQIVDAVKRMVVKTTEGRSH
jgi:hypothetical protein